MAYLVEAATRSPAGSASGEVTYDNFERPNEFDEDVVSQVALNTMHRICRVSCDNKRSSNLGSGCWLTDDYYRAYQNRLGQIDLQSSEGKELDKKFRVLKGLGVFYDGMLPSRFFSPIDELGCLTGHTPMSFSLKHSDGFGPSEALDAAIDGPSVIRSEEVCQLVYWKVVQYFLGRNDFDALFTATSTTPLMVSVAIQNNPIFAITEVLKDKDCGEGRLYFFQSGTPTLEVFPGRFYSQYEAKHLFCDSNGYQMMGFNHKKGQSARYLGLGLDPFGVGAVCITESLRQRYNAPPSGQEILPERLLKQNRVVTMGGKEERISYLEECFGAARLVVAANLRTHQIESPEAFESQGGGERSSYCGKINMIHLKKLWSMRNADSCRIWIHSWLLSKTADNACLCDLCKKD